MATIARMNVVLGMDSKDFESGVKNATSAGESLSSKLSKIGAGMTAGITLPIVGAATAAVKFATDFNSSMANVASLGVASDRVVELKSAVQAMAVETGKSTDDLAGGLYQVVSAFGDTADTAKILEINAKSAAAGLAETTDAINLTSAVTKGYGDTSAAAVQKVSDLALQTVALGQTTFPELAASMGRVVPIASSLGASQEELFAVMATATGVTGGAAEVSTQLRGVLQSLMAPTESMTGLMNSMGYSTADAMLKGEGLQGTIAAIVQASQASGAPLQNYIGSIEGQTLALALAGPQADSYVQKLAAMGDAAGATDKAFLAQTQGVNASGFAMQQLSIQGTVLLQKLGDGLAPALGQVLSLLTPVADAAINLASQFASADTGTQTMIVGALALVAALGPVLTMLPAISTALAVLTGPVGLVVAAVAALGAAWATNFGGIRDITTQIATEVGAGLQSLLSPLQMIGLAMMDAGVASGEAWEAIGLLPEPLAAVGYGFQNLYSSLEQAATMLGAFLAPAIARVQAAFAGVGPQLTQLSGPLAELQAAFVNLWTAVQPILTQFTAAIGVGLAVAASLGINSVAAIIANLPALIMPAISQITATVNLIATTFTSVAAIIAAVVNGDWAGAWKAAESLFQGFYAYFNSTLSNLQSIASAVFAVISQIVTSTLTDMGVNVEGTLRSLETFWTSIWDTMSKAVEPVMMAIDGLKKGIEDFSSWLGGISIPNPFAGISFPSLPAGFSLPGMATGGAVSAGVPYMVGERGREVFIPNVDGQIIPNRDLGGWTGDLAGAGGGGAGVNIAQVSVYNEVDIRALAYQVAQYQQRRR